MLLSRCDVQTLRAYASKAAATKDPETIQVAVLALSFFLVQREVQPGVVNYGLTQRERELLLRAMRGETNAEIGEALSISHRTVAKHLEHAYAKLGVHSRRQAARLVRGG